MEQVVDAHVEVDGGGGEAGAYPEADFTAVVADVGAGGGGGDEDVGAVGGDGGEAEELFFAAGHFYSAANVVGLRRSFGEDGVLGDVFAVLCSEINLTVPAAMSSS